MHHVYLLIQKYIASEFKWERESISSSPPVIDPDWISSFISSCLLKYAGVLQKYAFLFEVSEVVQLKEIFLWINFIIIFNWSFSYFTLSAHQLWECWKFCYLESGKTDAKLWVLWRKEELWYISKDLPSLWMAFGGSHVREAVQADDCWSEGCSLVCTNLVAIKERDLKWLSAWKVPGAI